MTATLTHSTFGGAGPKSSSVPVSTSWLKKLLLALATGSEVFAEAQEEARKAHVRYPFIVEW